jgi:DNA-binding transcriptional LysR family regulator
MSRLAHYFRELTYLKVILEHGSINRAATEIGLSQPALTRSIGRLEAALGVKLLNRSAKGVFPTPYGEAMLIHMKLIDSELERTAEEIESLRQGTGGTIICGATVGAISWLFSESINQFKRLRPKLRIRIVEGIPSALLGMLRTGEVDVVVCAKVENIVEADLVGESIGRDRVGLFAGRDSLVLKKPLRSLKDIDASTQWVLPNWSGDFYRLIQQKFTAEKMPLPTSAIETSSTTLLKAILKSNDRAIGISTSHLMDADIQQGTIKEIEGPWSFFASNTMIYRRGNIAPSPLVDLFAQCIRATSQSRGTG